MRAQTDLQPHKLIKIVHYQLQQIAKVCMYDCVIRERVEIYILSKNQLSVQLL